MKSLHSENTDEDFKLVKSLLGYKLAEMAKDFYYFSPGDVETYVEVHKQLLNHKKPCHVVDLKTHSRVYRLIEKLREVREVLGNFLDLIDNYLEQHLT